MYLETQNLNPENNKAITSTSRYHCCQSPPYLHLLHHHRSYRFPGTFAWLLFSPVLLEPQPDNKVQYVLCLVSYSDANGLPLNVKDWVTW